MNLSFAPAGNFKSSEKLKHQTFRGNLHQSIVLSLSTLPNHAFGHHDQQQRKNQTTWVILIEGAGGE